ncbi:hypothetical protein GJA_4421 [Janthinobacterium agaricidamnosum NBRC 102515 = DSM 9628]|uniref:Uncharacterized protein n=1 Tax=Janthinobacterium agaricidamnosum NBRC 102515 = DSM 9628 TaxID=1349767 RepID=W0VCE4_9BURK|nr:hypothetical protein GJA_4421 [Janthinobacterium agaricidamnosum NBRC 102515 = DSM 9628]
MRRHKRSRRHAATLKSVMAPHYASANISTTNTILFVYLYEIYMNQLNL